MIRLPAFFISVLLTAAIAHAQFGSFGDFPIDIDAEDTRYEGGVAYATGNVVIRYGETVVYCDSAQYSPETRDVVLTGNVRLFRAGQLFTAERALYNLETKTFNGADIRGDQNPLRFSTETLSNLDANSYLAKGAIFTTSDSSKPDYHLRAKSVRIYPKNRVIFRDVTLVIGRVPVFWFPYIYQSLEKEQSFTITPGYNDTFGAYLLGQYTFPIGENTTGRMHLDILSDRGIGLGLDTDWISGKNAQNWGRFRSYLLDDADPARNLTGLDREAIDSLRYRVSLQSRAYITEDVYTTLDINTLSDARFLQDFEQGEFRRNPNPDNMGAITKWDERFVGTFMVRKNLNEGDFDATERLPDLSWEMPRQAVFGNSGLFYESESSVGFLRRNFADGSNLPDYDTWRADTFHQLVYPKVVGGWLSLVPRLGVRATYYGDSGTFRDEVDTTINTSTQTDEFGNVTTTTSESSTVQRRLMGDGGVFRPVVNAGFEASFKVSKTFEQIQNRTWGLDGLRHVVQPYLNASYTYAGEDPLNILQFDRLNQSTRLPSVDYPQFNSIDSIDTGGVIRLGVRNRLQTRRDDDTINWLETDTFLNIYADRPRYGILPPLPGGRYSTPEAARRAILANEDAIFPDGGDFSNVFTRIRWTPLPWLAGVIDSQFPIFDEGFTEVNTSLNLMVNRNVQLNIGHRYLDGNSAIRDSNQINFGAYIRLNDHWAFSFRDAYEFSTGTLQTQLYEVHRDLSSVIGSLGVGLRDNDGATDFSVLLTFTLKDIPGVQLPFSIDPSDTGGSGGSRNR